MADFTIPIIRLEEIQDIEESELINQVDKTDGSNAWRTIDKQIKAFAGLVEQISTKFASLENLYSSLQAVNDIPFGTPRRVGGSSYREPAHNSTSTALAILRSPDVLNTLGRLRESLNRLKKRANKTSRESGAISDIDTLLKDLQFMRSLKKYFDEKIYCVLYRHFYDPFTVVIGGVNSQNADEPNSTLDDVNAKIVVGFESEVEEETPVFLTEMVSIGLTSSSSQNRLFALERMEKITDEVYQINQRWDLLCSLDDLSEDNFEAESRHRIAGFSNTDKILPVFRLLPDLLCKCSKLIELSRDWLTQYRSLNGELATGWEQPPTVDEFHTKLNYIESLLSRKETEIRHLQHSMDIHTKDLAFLTSREDRVKSLVNSCEKLAAHRASIGEVYKGLIQRRLECVQKLENTVQGTKRYLDISTELRQLESNILEQNKELRLAEYGLEIAQSDCQLEAEAATNFVIFSQTERERIDKVNKDLDLAKRLCRTLQLRTTLINTNFNRMMEILTTKLGPKMISGGVEKVVKHDDPRSISDSPNDRRTVSDCKETRTNSGNTAGTHATYTIGPVKAIEDSRFESNENEEATDATLSDDEMSSSPQVNNKKTSKDTIHGTGYEPFQKAMLINQSKTNS